MKNFILVLALALSTICFAQTSKETYTKFSGTIKNVQQSEMMILGTVDGKRKMKKIKVNEDGSFNDTLHISAGKFTLFVNGPNFSKIKVIGDAETRKEVFGLMAYFEAG